MITDRNDMLHILVAVDGSNSSMATVRWIARIAVSGAPLRCTILNVQKPIMSGEVGLIAPASIALGERERSAADILEGASAVLRAGGVQFTLDGPVSYTHLTLPTNREV